MISVIPPLAPRFCPSALRGDKVRLVYLESPSCGQWAIRIRYHIYMLRYKLRRGRKTGGGISAADLYNRHKVDRWM